MQMKTNIYKNILVLHKWSVSRQENYQRDSRSNKYNLQAQFYGKFAQEIPMHSLYFPARV